MEEILTDLLLRFRTLSEDSHSLLDEIFKIVDGKCYQMTYEDEYGNQKSFFLNQHSKHMLRDFILNPEETASMQSDYMKDYCIGKIHNVQVKEFVRVRSTEGSHFPYWNRSESDLSRYQIYRNKEERKEYHCLLFALEQLGVNASPVHNYIINTHVEMRDLKKIALKLGVNIDLFLFGKNRKIHANKYPKKDRFHQTATIALYKEHYFVFESLGGTNSLELVRGLYEQGLFEPNYDLTIPQQRREVSLEDCIGEQAPSLLKEKKSGTKYTVSYADTESITKPFHKAFLYARYSVGPEMADYKVYQETGDYKGFKSFLNSFNGSYNLIYFHNLKYDWYMIKGCPFIKLISMTQKDSTYYQIVFLYAKKKFDLRDSYKLIPKKLSDFTYAFGLSQGKQEFILYNLYSDSNSFDSRIDYVLYQEYNGEPFEEAYVIEDGRYKKVTVVTEDSLLVDQRIVVSKRILDYCGNYFHGNRYYHLSHCRSYIHSDCSLLRHGVEKFREAMLQLLQVDCLTELTLPAMVHRCAFNRGCYTGVYSLVDNLREFVAQSIQGGKVCSRDNAMWKCKAIIKPIDAKSMYPSAIRRICREGGFPIGPAKIIEEFDPRSYYYVVKVKILSVKKPQQLPFVSYLTENGNRCYTNTLSNRIVVIDKITLEDWIEFQHIEYEFIEGIYWDNDGNSNMGTFVEELYESRMKHIELGNTTLAEITKLTLNSMYGKTIMKPSYVKKVIRDNNKADDYILENFERLISKEECGSQTVFFLSDSSMGHSNMAHIGGMILSMARRMVNEVVNLATENDIIILYQDTDSLHVVDSHYEGGILKENQLEKLNGLYQERYGKQLIGKQLEQFDFDLKLAGCSQVHSTGCIILGKKAYIHRVVGVDANGSIVKQDIPKIAGVNLCAMNEYPDKWRLYKRLYKGEKITFDLIYGDGVAFQYRETVTTRDSFKKEIHFEGERKQLG
jgi:hypothetical protein